jgi:uncharacterized damage-inducible protein DinB
MDFQKELIAEYERETASTRKMLEAIPAGADFSYKPHPKAMPLNRLAGHITDMGGDWAMQILTQEKMEMAPDHKHDPYIPANKAAAIEKFDKGVPAIVAKLAAATPAQWEEHWKFIFGGQTLVDQPRHQAFRELVLSHMIHHRAQLGVYVRMLDGKLPGIYGPSGDGM